MKRRTFLLVPVALAAQPAPVRVEIVWSKATSVPEEFARESVVFPRAYTCCPESGPARRALETGRFPHVARAEESIPPVFANITVITAESGDDEGSPFERSIRVPLAIRWPEKLVPRIADDILISHADVLPTLLAWAGGAILPDLQGALQGRDLSALVARHEGETPDSIYVEGNLGQKDEWRVVVRGFDKIVFNLQEEATHLYNLADDPMEETNLVGSREHELMQDSMLALARRWRRKLGDGVDPSGLRLR
jgi:arylsulfatase A-like enzyme